MTPAGRLLIVEDDPLICEYYRDVLGGRARDPAGGGATGIEVVTVSDGAAAVDAVRRAVEEGRPFCGGFFDLVLPGRPSGVDALQQIHGIDADMLCCVVTGADTEIIQHIESIFAGRDGDWEYLQKPAAPEEIYRRGMSMATRWHERRRRITQGRRAEALAGLGRIVTHVAGELRGPLDSLHADLKALRDRLPPAGALPDEVQPVLAAAFERTRIAGELVAALVALDPTTHTEHAAADVERCVDNAVMLAGRGLADRAELVREIDGALRLRCNPGDLTRLVLEALLVAARAIHDRGTVTLRATHASATHALIEIESVGGSRRLWFPLAAPEAERERDAPSGAVD